MSDGHDALNDPWRQAREYAPDDAKSHSNQFGPTTAIAPGGEIDQIFAASRAPTASASIS
jgi:hypothetical protein